jgi:type IV pilus assembly protein PilM
MTKVESPTVIAYNIKNLTGFVVCSQSVLTAMEVFLFLRRWLQQRNPQNLVGLDIDSDVIKLLKINASVTPPLVEYIAIQSLPEGAILKNEIKNQEAVVTALKTLFRTTGLGKDVVALAIPRSLALIKSVTIDKRLNEEEIESRAWVEANRNFPDLVGDIHLDFSIVGPSAQDASQLEMVLVACRKEQIKPFLDVLRESNLTPKVLDVNCYALERALGVMVPQTEASNSAVALLNLNFTLSSLIVSQNNHLIYAHDHSYDGHRLITQVRNYLKEEGKNMSDPIEAVLPAGDNQAYTDILKENLTSHLRHTIHFFYSSRPNINIQTLILAGDCATVPNIATFIHEEVHIETKLAEPFANMAIAPNVDQALLNKYASTLTLCSGLALSNIK